MIWNPEALTLVLDVFRLSQVSKAIILMAFTAIIIIAVVRKKNGKRNWRLSFLD